MSWKTEEIDRAVLSQIGNEPVAIVDLTFGRNYRTIRAAVERLYKSGVLEREWDGNQRFGRYLYSIADTTKPPDSPWVERYEVPAQDQAKAAKA